MAETIASQVNIDSVLDEQRSFPPPAEFSEKAQIKSLAESLSRQRISIEVPGEILEVERTDVPLAREWREATRWAFRESLKAGFVVAEFTRSIRGQQGPGAYLLQRATVNELIPEA